MAVTCEDCHRELTAYADQALAGERREEIATHLVACADCRAELAEINQVRSLLTTCAAESAPSAPCHLADRLVAIAGHEADRQLWLAPERSGCLPSPRRRRRNRVLALGSMTTAGVLGALSGAWLMAPQLPVVSDPDAAQISLSDEAGSGLRRSMVSPTSSSTTSPHPMTSHPVASSATVSEATVASLPLVDADHPECPPAFACPEELTGLPRISLDTGTPGQVTSIYASARGQVLVLQHHGRLLGQPDQVPGQFRQAWQSGETVFCVVAGDDAVGEAVVADLPHEQAVTGQGLERVWMGLRALAGHRGR